MTNNVGYRWVCLACREQNKTTVDEGETSRSARIRGAEHLGKLEGNKKKMYYINTKSKII